MLTILPRTPLGCLPTPVHTLPRIGKELGIDLKIKRDDLTGLAAGGNKVRKLEYLVSDALKNGATVLMTAGSIQSNHVLQTIAAGRKAGLRTIAVLDGRKPSASSGNYLLDELLDADIEFMESERFVEDVVGHMQARRKELEAVGEKVYIIPVGGSNALGSQGYVTCMQELATQYQEMGEPPPDYVVVATGSVGTYAGTLVGCAHHWPTTKVLGIVVTTNYFAKSEHVVTLANETAALAGLPMRWLSEDLLLNYDYIGPGYGIPSDLGNRAIDALAQHEGVFLDPTYTGKVFAGLTGCVKRGQIPQGSRVLFIHTGGATALLAR